ncbi:AAA domain-containing protein [Cristinia sonorae]|uniref:AAA domain-containing protein n=1 Tax=Cristinia sonorae TaxID=1940300 RepID=A0A8K0UR43_9AGAR|nr:AAA domain-containing protein [Cristinia sonorae]
MAQRRLTQILHELTSPNPQIGTLKLGEISFPVHSSSTPSRLPHLNDTLLDAEDDVNANNLYFLLQKYILGQDVFLLSQPGPYARRLAMTFCSIANLEYEHVALHRDVGETELKQGRELRHGGNLVYVDSAAVRAVKHGRVLIIEGVEKAERGIMPLLNNLLENREINLDDGTHIVHPKRFALMDPSDTSNPKKRFIPAHAKFRVIAIAAPVPPYVGYPIDPPFRSRFQARFIDPIGAMLSLQGPTLPGQQLPLIYEKLRNILLSTQYASESRQSIDTAARTSLQAFPQTALAKLHALVTIFPPPEQLSPSQLARLVLTIHPGLANSQFVAWAILSRQTEEAGLGPLGSPALNGENDHLGYLGYQLTGIERISESKARIHFTLPEGSESAVLEVPAGPRDLLPFPWRNPKELGFNPTDRFMGTLTCMLQAHALGWDISYVPPAAPSTASCSTTTLVKTFGALLGYEVDTLHMYKELGGRELIMRRKIESDGSTSWEASPLIDGAWKGRLVHLSGLDVIGSTAGSLARLIQDREVEIWEGKRLVAQADENEIKSGELSVAHPSFRVVVTASKSLPLKDWLTDEHANMFFPVPSIPMPPSEESAILLQTGCSSGTVDTLLAFAERYRSSMTSDAVQKNRKLGTRALVRLASRLAKFPGEKDLHKLLSQAILAEFLPATESMTLQEIFEECDIKKRSALFNPSPLVKDGALLFPAATDPLDSATEDVFIPLFDTVQDPAGVASHVPHMEHFYDNSLQTGLMRDLAIDLEVLGEHIVLLGNQGVGKNKVVDRLCQLLRRPQEYIQLHRDTTVNQLMFTTSLESGVLKYTDSPLLRAIKLGRVIVVDEADKAAEHVVAIFRSLAGQGELTLADGRRVRRKLERGGDVVVHPNFRLILLANRPGYPFLGNHFLQVLGDNFSCHAVTNPDMASERKLLSQLAPELDSDMILRLVAAFQDLRVAYETGSLTYPYSLRELINVVRHIKAFPDDPLETTLRNVFDFDVYRPDTIKKLAEILDHHGLIVKRLGLDAARESSEKKVMEVKFEPKETSLSKPKFGKEDPNNEPHTGGNTWSGGTGGRDTAGMGGRGGYMRLYKGHEIKQIPDKLKNDVPDHIREEARELARRELARRLEELNMSTAEARGYGALLEAVQPHITLLFDLLENLAAREEERIWIKRQTDGELDDSRLTEGLTGESSVYKRRGMAKPELGRPQIKPKRIRFVFDISGSMYRFQYDGRLARSLETAVMLMETFDRLTRKDKYVWDIVGHSGDSSIIPLVEAGNYPTEIRDRWKIVEKMEMVTQYTFAGDNTVEAIEKSVTEVSKHDADDWFVIAITDANFGRYGITPDQLKRAMTQQPKVRTALICIGEGAEAFWIPQKLPGRGFRVANTADIPTVLRSILSSMVDS